MNPEDGDPGVFCHEFSHDLGLPDEYDTAGTPQDSAAGFWTIMAQGAWLGREWGLGSAPGPMNAWDKAALGFTTPKVVKRGATGTVKLQPAATGTSDATSVIIQLPKRKHVIELSGKDGAKEWYSDMGDDLDTTLTTADPVTVPAGDPTLTFRTWYDMESDYDYGFVLVSTTAAPSGPRSGAPTRRSCARGVWALTGTDDTALGRHRPLRPRRLGRAEGPPPLPLPHRRGRDAARLGGHRHRRGRHAAPGHGVHERRVAARRTGRGPCTATRTTSRSTAPTTAATPSLQNCYEFDRDLPAWVDWFAYNEGLLLHLPRHVLDGQQRGHASRRGWLAGGRRAAQPGRVWSTTTRWATGGRASSSATRPSASAHTPSQTIYFRDYETATSTSVERAAPGKLAAPSFNDALAVLVPRDAGAGVKVPAGLGVRIRVKSVAADGMTVSVDNNK